MTDGITIRALESQADLAACVALQRDTWGRGFADVVPASILQVAQKVGGVAAGAFDPSGQLVGFVFGMTGLKEGDVVHWSDMLAVRPAVQNRGLGRRLKEFQRQAVAKLGAKRIYWTYDPLVARNAHINFNVLGATATEYVRDMYGQVTGSDLHRGIGTDRLIVSWPVDERQQETQRREAERVRESAESAASPVLGDVEQPRASMADALSRSACVRIAIPTDIEQMLVRDEARALKWREASRSAFEASWTVGYRVDGFRLDPANARGFYLLSRASAR